MVDEKTSCISSLESRKIFRGFKTSILGRTSSFYSCNIRIKLKIPTTTFFKLKKNTFYTSIPWFTSLVDNWESHRSSGSRNINRFNKTIIVNQHSRYLNSVTLQNRSVLNCRNEKFIALPTDSFKFQNKFWCLHGNWILEKVI